MIDMTTLQTRIVTGLKHHLQPLGVTAVVERDQNAPAPSYPFVGFKWISITPEPGASGVPLRLCRQVIRSLNVMCSTRTFAVRSYALVTVYDRDGTSIHSIAQSAHDWFSIPELAGDWLEPTGAVIVEVTPITDRDTVLDEQIERARGSTCGCGLLIVA